MNEIKIIVADDHPIFRGGLKSVIGIIDNPLSRCSSEIAAFASVGFDGK